MGFKGRAGAPRSGTGNGADVAVRLADLATRSEGEGLAKLAAWARPFLHTWSHVRVSVLALRIKGEWHGRAAALVLTDDPRPRWTPASTERVWAGQGNVPITSLPELLEDIGGGRIEGPRSPIGQAISLRDGSGAAFKARSGWSHDARGIHATRDHDRFYRFEVSWEAGGNLGTLFDPPGEAYAWLEDAQREFEVLGHGTIVDAARRLEIVESRESLYWDRASFVNLYAPVPVAFDTITQSVDRTRIHVKLLRGALIDADALTVSVERTDGPADTIQRAQAPRENALEFAAPSAREATFQIAYQGQRIQRETRDILPPLGANVRVIALSTFEQTSLLDAGLDQRQRAVTERSEDAFERSVHHFVGLLGFTVCWWGPHAKTPLKMPDDQADLLAFSADDSVILVVDCTLMPNKDMKTVKLVRRAREIENAIRDVVQSPPRVVPVLAIGVPRREVAQLLRFPGSNTEVTLLALDEMEAALAAIRLGKPHREVVEDLDEPLRCGFEGEGRFRLWPGEFR